LSALPSTHACPDSAGIAGQAESQAALALLVRRYPDTLERLEKVAAG